VVDNGTGFIMAYADKLFKPFQWLHSPEKFVGTEICLASIQNIIRRLGGKLLADSQ
jgi:light-regulated signal transduction histidine kinase (bacteriophytochrome)